MGEIVIHPRCINCGDEFTEGDPGTFIGSTFGSCSEYCQRSFLAGLGI